MAVVMPDLLLGDVVLVVVELIFVSELIRYMLELLSQADLLDLQVRQMV